ncbi:MAG: prolipoprotein diacylglyceryl transferase [Bacteroidota bacterium]
MKLINHIWLLLKKRWGISSNIQVGIILLAFALSGFSTLFTHRYIDSLLGITDETAFWIEILVFVLLILPIYNTFLIIWGTILGQRKFVIKFIKTKIHLLTKWKFDKSERL